jgi:hypothetical protein
MQSDAEWGGRRNKVLKKKNKKARHESRKAKTGLHLQDLPQAKDQKHSTNTRTHEKRTDATETPIFLFFFFPEAIKGYGFVVLLYFVLLRARAKELFRSWHLQL